MSQEDFARALGSYLNRPVSQSQISDWERGRFEPGAAVLLALAEMTNLSVDELRGLGAGPMAERVARLEELVDHLTLGRGREPAEAADEDRVARLERESERLGGLLAQMLKALDQAGLWPADAALRTEEGSDAAKGKRRLRGSG